MGHGLECVEAALMYSLLGFVHSMSGEENKHREYLETYSAITAQVAYCEGVSRLCERLVSELPLFKAMARATSVFAATREKALQHHDLAAAATLCDFAATHILAHSGDIQRALSLYREPLELHAKTGGTKDKSGIRLQIGWRLCELGELEQARESMFESLRAAQNLPQSESTNVVRVPAFLCVAEVLLAQRLFEQASEALSDGIQLCGDHPVWYDSYRGKSLALMGRIALRQEKRHKAGECFGKAVVLGTRGTL